MVQPELFIGQTEGAANGDAIMTRVQPPTVTAAQIVHWHVANAENADPRFRGDVAWAQGYLKESVRIGWLNEAEANEIRAAVGWDVTAVQMEMFEEE